MLPFLVGTPGAGLLPSGRVRCVRTFLDLHCASGAWRIPLGERGWPSLCEAYFLFLISRARPCASCNARQGQTNGNSGCVALLVVGRAAYCWGRLALAGQIEHLKVSLENKCSSQLSVVLGLSLGFAWRLQVRTAGQKALSGTLSLQQ